MKEAYLITMMFMLIAIALRLQAIGKELEFMNDTIEYYVEKTVND